MRTAFIVLAAATLVFGGGEARAEAWGPIRAPALGDGVLGCTPSEDQGDTFCFGLRCAPADRTPEWVVAVVGHAPLGELPIRIAVDGAPTADITLVRQDHPGVSLFTRPYGPDDDRLLEALRAGSGMTAMGAEFAHQISLRGSARALSGVLAACAAPASAPAPVAAAAPASVPSAPAGDAPPVLRAVLDEIRDDCRAGGREAIFGEGAVQSADINGDGRFDYLIDAAGIDCPMGATYLCGAMGCQITLLVSRGDGHARANLLGAGPRLAGDAMRMACPRGGGEAVVRDVGGRLVMTTCRGETAPVE